MNRKVAKKKGATRSPLIVGLWVVMLAALIGELFFSAWCRVQCTRTGYEITAVTAQNRKLSTVRRDLRIELERLKSPKRIEAKAVSLGLMVPTPEQMLRFR